MEANWNNENSNKPISKSLAIKIAVPVFIIIGLIIVWFIKNPDVMHGGGDEIAENSDTTDNASDDSNSDFELNITEEINLEQLKSYDIPIVIDFGADSCIPCKEMAPVLEKLNEELRGKAIIKFVDVWKYPDLARDYPISVIPTQVLIDTEGKPYVPSDETLNGIIMYSSKDTEEHVFTTHEGGITEDEMMRILEEMGLEE